MQLIGPFRKELRCRTGERCSRRSLKYDDGRLKGLILRMTLGANDGPTSRREGGASNNPAGAANA